MGTTAPLLHSLTRQLMGNGEIAVHLQAPLGGLKEKTQPRPGTRDV